MHIPSAVGKGITQGALLAAFLVALAVNRRLIVRPNVFLCLVSLLVIEALITSLQAQHFGTVYRTFRLAGFVATLWLLTPWWGRRDLLLVRCHLAALPVLLGSVLLGLLVVPGHALPGQAHRRDLANPAHRGGALRGGYDRAGGRALALRPSARPGHPSSSSLWRQPSWSSRTRGLPWSAMVAGILVAGLSLIVAKARVRKLFVAGAAVAVDRDPDAVRHHHHLAGSGRGHARADQPHRPDPSLGCPAQLSTRQVPGDLRFRPVEHFVQRPPHRQQLVASYQDQGLFRGVPYARRSCCSCS